VWYSRLYSTGDARREGLLVQIGHFSCRFDSVQHVHSAQLVPRVRPKDSHAHEQNLRFRELGRTNGSCPVLQNVNELCEDPPH
jgi:hypothetical protein